MLGYRVTVPIVWRDDRDVDRMAIAKTLEHGLGPIAVGPSPQSLTIIAEGKKI